MPRMTGGQAIVESLLAHGVDTVFGVPGIQLDNLFDAFYERRNALRVIHTRHEQGAGFMAMGYAQAKGEAGVYAVVPGPGLLNSLTALATANSANLPVLGLTGQIPSYQIGLNYGIAHELKDQLMVSRGVVDWAWRGNHPSEVPGLLNDAFRHMHSGRKSAAVFEMSPDILGQAAPVEPLSPEATRAAPPPEPELVEKAAKVLAAAKRPIILAGGGAVGAEAEVKAVAERLGAPVVMSPNALGLLPADHPLAVGMVEGQELWDEADVALIAGSRFTVQGLAWGREAEVELVRVDIDPTQIVKPRRAGLALVTSVASGLAALGKALVRGEPAEWTSLAEVRRAAQARFDELEPLAGYARALRAALPRDGLVYADVTRFSVFIRFAMPIYASRSFFMPGFQATLGWAYPAALGGKVACPERKVVAVAGDGGFMFSATELATAVHHQIPVTVLVFDNKAYGNVKTIQANSYGGRHIAVDLTNPDFVAMARAFGMTADRAETPAELEEVLTRHLAAEAPSLIEVPLMEAPNVWSLVRRPPSAGVRH
jgi:acetolactate synthase I/II/III large subunit